MDIVDFGTHFVSFWDKWVKTLLVIFASLKLEIK